MLSWLFQFLYGDFYFNFNLTELEKYNAKKAHEEMVIKSGGGINNLYQIIDDFSYELELKEQKIARLLQEISYLENKLIELATSYKFVNNFVIIEIILFSHLLITTQYNFFFLFFVFFFSFFFFFLSLSSFSFFFFFIITTTLLTSHHCYYTTDYYYH